MFSSLLETRGYKMSTYCHARSISNVGTKNLFGTEDMSSKNLRKSLVSGRYQYLGHLPIVPRNTTLQNSRIAGEIEKAWFCPSQFYHLLGKAGLSQNLSLYGISMSSRYPWNGHIQRQPDRGKTYNSLHWENRSRTEWRRQTGPPSSTPMLPPKSCSKRD